MAKAKLKTIKAMTDCRDNAFIALARAALVVEKMLPNDPNTNIRSSVQCPGLVLEIAEVMWLARALYGERFEYRDGAIFIDGWRVCKDSLSIQSVRAFVDEVIADAQRRYGSDRVYGTQES